jgi:hypothetical protein
VVEALPEATLHRTGTKWQLDWQNLQVIITLWSSLIGDLPDGDPFVVGGVMMSGSDFPAANIVCELIDGRLTWSLLRFKASGRTGEYKYGPRDQLHGFHRVNFVQQRQYMLFPGMHVWTLEKTPLTPDVILDLLRGAIESDMETSRERE